MYLTNILLQSFILLFFYGGFYFMKNRFFYRLLFILFVSFVIIFSLYSTSFGAYPKLVNKILNAFESIKDYLIAIATPVAAVAIASGFLTQKFSFGDEERIRTGKKLIRTSIVSYAFILALDLIISLIQSLIG